jgi:hypothetical protein
MIRNCLKCNVAFESDGPHNRLCAACNLHNTKTYNMKVYQDPGTLPPNEILTGEVSGKKKKGKPKDT